MLENAESGNQAVLSLVYVNGNFREVFFFRQLIVKFFFRQSTRSNIRSKKQTESWTSPK